MFTIKNNYTDELEIKKSRFITNLYKINSIDEINNILLSIKKEHPFATHYCYAYIINGYKKSSDDGEPGGTAGIPILQVLDKNNLNYILCVVIRYFGGIKLGAGGLVRAYTKSVSDALKKSDIVELISGYQIKLVALYEDQKKIDYILKDIYHTKEYNNDVTYFINISQDDLDLLSSYNYEIIKKIYIEK
ncbi:MAG: YigZ family protein [Bacilli bacterium]|nr:YigZ family protein [Bacilli bacterium]